MPHCPEIFKNVFINRINNDNVYVAPCCQSRGHSIRTNAFDFKHDKHLTYLRNEFLSGKKPKECDSCWKVENVGHKSRRQSAIEYHNNKKDTKVNLESIDFNVTWACNLACIMCGPECSSTWAKELGIDADRRISLGVSQRNSNNIIDNITFENVKKVHFNGGEPFINNDHFKFLKSLKTQKSLGDVLLSYNTNGTFFPSESIVDLWQEVNLVKIFFSIDATHDAFNYIRYPANWEFVEENMLKMKEKLPSNVVFGINATVGCYNLFEILDVKKWFDRYLSTNKEGDLSDFNWQIANNFHPKNLTKDIRNDISSHLENDNVLKNISFLLKNDDISDINYQWIDNLDEIDKRRGTDWKKSLKIGNYFKI